MYLIHGATGFIGRAVRELLEERGTPYVGLGRKTKIVYRGCGSVPEIGSLATGAHDDPLDLSSPLAAVIFVAGPAQVGTQPDELRAAHVGGLEDALKALRRRGFEAVPFIYASSGMVYGRRSSMESLSETASPTPDSEYGRVKLACEAVLRERGAGLRTCAARLFNVTGPGQTGTIVGDIAVQVAPIIAGAQAGFHLRSKSTVVDLIDVREAAGALVALAQTADPPQVVNVCSGRGVSSDDLITATCAAIGRWVPVTYDDGGETRLALIGNPDLIRAKTGWQAKKPLERIMYDAIMGAPKA